MNLFEYTYDLVRQIPPGKVSTYGAVAIALGDKSSSPGSWSDDESES